MDPRDNLPPFLSKMDGLMSIKHDSRRGLSKVVGLKLTQLGGIVHGESLSTLKTSKFLFLPFVQISQYWPGRQGCPGPFVRSVRRRLPRCNAT